MGLAHGLIISPLDQLSTYNSSLLDLQHLTFHALFPRTLAPLGIVISLHNSRLPALTAYIFCPVYIYLQEISVWGIEGKSVRWRECDFEVARANV